MKKLFVGTLIACAMTSSVAFADATADRKAAMKNVGMAMGAMVKMLKGEADYDQQTAMLSLAVLNNGLTGLSSLFPAGSETGGDTTVSPKIWSDMDGFNAAIEKAKKDTNAAMAAKPVDLDAFKAVFGSVAGNCKSCHEAYRIAKK